MKHILILTGASGVGKTTLAMRLLDSGGFSYVRSATTRGKRGDIHDDEYIYLSREEFLSRVSSGEMLEHMEYGGNLYGTPRAELDRIFAEGKVPLLVLDLVGVKSFRALKTDFRVIAFYIYDSLNEIEKRLYKRELAAAPTIDRLEAFAKRKEANIRDYLLLDELSDAFDSFIRNSDLDEAFSEIKRIYSYLAAGNTANREENKKIASRLAGEAKGK